jgi:C1A family cysteine protease
MNVEAGRGWGKTHTFIHGKKRVLNWRPALAGMRREWSGKAEMPPPSLDPLDIAVPIWDQLSLGSCTAHGNGFLFAYRILRELGKVFMPSRLFIYYCERMLEGTTDRDIGAVVHDGLTALEKYGCPPEKLWPYNLAKFDRKPPKRIWKQGLKEIATAGATVPLNVDSIKASLLQDLPVSFGFGVFESFMGGSWLKRGMMPMPVRGERIVGGHCVVFVGYDDSKSAFWVRNSWGAGWAIGGRFLMPYENLKYCGDGVNLSRVA